MVAAMRVHCEEEVAPLLLPGDSMLPGLRSAVKQTSCDEGCKVDLGSASQIGQHHVSNEDWVFYAPAYSHGISFKTFGVSDGHHGDEASKLISDKLPLAVNKHLKEDMDVVNAYRHAVRECEESLREVSPDSKAGACVVSVTVAGPNVWCANLGDCRCVVVKLSTSRKVKSLHWMSTDHKAELERARIEEMGGKVVKRRVGGLVPSRCVGDFDVKAKVPHGVVSIEPELRVLELGEGAEALVICATDGMWDVVSGWDISALINDHADPTDASAVAQKLLQLALKRGTKDDCSVIAGFVSTDGSPASSRTSSGSAAAWNTTKHRVVFSL